MNIDVTFAGALHGAGFLWRPDVVITDVSHGPIRANDPIEVQLEDGRRVEVVAVHQSPLHIEAARRFVALELPEGTIAPRAEDALAWPAPIAPRGSTLPPSAWWGWVFPDLDDAAAAIDAVARPLASTAAG